MKIISRYLLKEHVGPFVFSLTALTSIMLLQYIARRFGDLVGKGLPWSVIVRFFVLSVPFTVAMTLPMAVLVAVLYAFSRLASENEITALKAGGVSMRTLMIPAIGAGILMGIFMLLFNDQVLPRANHELAVLQTNIFNTKPTFALRPQVINAVKEGQLYLRAGHLDEGTSRMREVTIYDLSDPSRRRTVYADSGLVELAPNRTDLLMTLYHGEVQTMETQRPGQLERLFYIKYLLNVPDVAKGFQAPTGDSATKSDREMSVCEMQDQLRRYGGALQRSREELARAEWAELRDKGVKAPEPKAQPLRVPYGIGGFYCSLADRLTKLFTVAEAHAAEAPPAPAAAFPQAGPGQSRPPGDTSRKGAAVPPGVQVTPAVPGQAPSLGADRALQVNEARMHIDNARYYTSRYSIEIEKKFALAAACIVFVLVGAPIALRFPRGGVGLVIGVSFLIFAFYYVGLIAGESLANKGYMSPFWAMWAANVVMLVIAVPLLLRMGREVATSRGGGTGEKIAQLRSRVGRLFHLGAS